MAAPTEETQENCIVKATVCAWNNHGLSPPPTVTCSYIIGEFDKGTQ